MGQSILSGQLRLDAETTAPKAARMFVAEVLTELGHGDAVETAQMICSELVTNAVAETRRLGQKTPITLHISTPHGFPVIEVWDCSINPPVLQDVTDLEECGRGLSISRVLAEHLDWEIYETCKCVWARLRVAEVSAG